jgi:hypothetical protein
MTVTRLVAGLAGVSSLGILEGLATLNVPSRA